MKLERWEEAKSSRILWALDIIFCATGVSAKNLTNTIAAVISSRGFPVVWYKCILSWSILGSFSELTHSPYLPLTGGIYPAAPWHRLLLMSASSLQGFWQYPSSFLLWAHLFSPWSAPWSHSHSYDSGLQESLKRPFIKSSGSAGCPPIQQAHLSTVNIASQS